LARTLLAVAAVLDRHPGRGPVIGGIAVIARGVRRLTRDVDIVIDGATIGLDALVAELTASGVVPRIPDAVEFAEETQVLLMRHAESGVDVDVSRAWLPFELESIARSPLEMIAGVRLPIARADDLVIFKAVAWRPQDQQDVERLLALHALNLDLDRIRRIVSELGAALEIDRLRELNVMIARVLGTGQ
jgi:hypothetical protein